MGKGEDREPVHVLIQETVRVNSPHAMDGPYTDDFWNLEGSLLGGHHPQTKARMAWERSNMVPSLSGVFFMCSSIVLI